ncbi:HD domain-containing protein [Polyangium sp. 6x1]|uniref:HD domain-containing protein n=1 Tax=Polyangium sp. 6x1 TaxID=3042689 RepID=UPI002482E934|nr:HD domain-containing protein [Polyangium sp. 6x1]MDI1442864.1 HD domain-containing protein [Polyangium sp. 6x1]
MTFSPDTYARALGFAADAHGAQRVPGKQHPYITHVVTVAAEILAVATKDSFDVELAMTCALLHDTLEDTSASEEEMTRLFGASVACGVRALSKDARLPKEEQMADSLARIQREPREVWMVKLADRITNLAAPPPYWSREKRIAYREEARRILAALGPASAPLAARLEAKIEAYGDYIGEAP